jgi:hypothetical protein
MAKAETLSKLYEISKVLEENLRKIDLEIAHLKSISDQDNFSLDSLLLSFKNEKKDEYVNLIDSLNTPESMKTIVREMLLTLLTGTSEEIKIRIQNLNDLIEQDVRIILKRCYLEYKIDEYSAIEEELCKIKQTIFNVEHLKDSTVIPKDLNNVLDQFLDIIQK